jgi:hypothetical protein
MLSRAIRQMLAYALFGAALMLLSRAPAWRPIPPGTALVQLSVQRSGARLQPCRKLTQAELARRAPNMRAAEECPRGRSPVRVVLEIDGRVAVDETAPPSGLAHDGVSNVYRRVTVAAGEHRLRLRMIDDLRAPQRAEERTQTVRLEAGRVFSVGYSSDQARL